MKKKIVIHCSAGSQRQTAADLVSFFLRPASKGGRGWKRPGYHYIIEASGRVVNCVEESGIANGAVGYNRDSIHVCYIGGVDGRGKPVDNRTEAQKRAMRELVADIRRRRPEITDVCGHRDLSPDLNGNGIVEPREWIKACPCFEVRAEFRT